jgi:hypothetical protein
MWDKFWIKIKEIDRSTIEISQISKQLQSRHQLRTEISKLNKINKN